MAMWFLQRYESGIGVPMNQLAKLYLFVQVKLAELNYRSPKSTEEASRQLYKNAGVDITPLHYAVQQHDTDRIRKHADGYKQFADSEDNNGRTPLHWAAEKGYADIVCLLMSEFGANTSIRDDTGRRPLYVAIECGCIEVIQLLKAKDISLHIQGT